MNVHSTPAQLRVRPVEARRGALTRTRGSGYSSVPRMRKALTTTNRARHAEVPRKRPGGIRKEWEKSLLLHLAPAICLGLRCRPCQCSSTCRAWRYEIAPAAQNFPILSPNWKLAENLENLAFAEHRRCLVRAGADSCIQTASIQSNAARRRHQSRGHARHPLPKNALDSEGEGQGQGR